MLEFETCSVWYIHMLKYYYQLHDVGEKEVSVFTALKLLCTILFENSNISVRIKPLFRVRVRPSCGDLALPISMKSPPSIN